MERPPTTNHRPDFKNIVHSEHSNLTQPCYHAPFVKTSPRSIYGGYQTKYQVQSTYPGENKQTDVSWHNMIFQKPVWTSKGSLQRLH